MPGCRTCNAPRGICQAEACNRFRRHRRQPVDIVLVLLLPAAAEHEALGALALVARTLRSPENLVRLRGAKNASELYSALLG